MSFLQTAAFRQVCTSTLIQGFRIVRQPTVSFEGSKRFMSKVLNEKYEFIVAETPRAGVGLSEYDLDPSTHTCTR
jgi:hypothetical protein